MTLLPECPMCGFRPDLEDPDTLYPCNRQKTVWTLNCSECNGGCGFEVLAPTADAAVERWFEESRLKRRPDSDLI